MFFPIIRNVHNYIFAYADHLNFNTEQFETRLPITKKKGSIYFTVTINYVTLKTAFHLSTLLIIFSSIE